MSQLESLYKSWQDQRRVVVGWVTHLMKYSRIKDTPIRADKEREYDDVVDFDFLTKHDYLVIIEVFITRRNKGPIVLLRAGL